MIIMLPYKWRGRKYQTLNGLSKAVFKEHPGCSFSFDRDFMYVRDRRRNFECRYKVARTSEYNFIADQADGD